MSTITCIKAVEPHLLLLFGHKWYTFACQHIPNRFDASVFGLDRHDRHPENRRVFHCQREGHPLHCSGSRVHFQVNWGLNNAARQQNNPELMAVSIACKQNSSRLTRKKIRKTRQNSSRASKLDLAEVGLANTNIRELMLNGGDRHT